MNIYYALERDITTSKCSFICWSQIPNWEKIKYILSISIDNTYNLDKNHGVVSVEQLSTYLDKYRKNKNIMNIVNSIYEFKIKNLKNKLTEVQKSNYWDNAIEEAFHIYRHWFQFTVPKTFRVVDSLQRYVCQKHNKRAGSYSYFVQQLENDFLDENISILMEYGIPNDTVRRLSHFIPKDLDEDSVVQYIKTNMNRLSIDLLQYEKERIKQCL